MRTRGWKWSQATVWAVEKGERPLRLAEAEDLVSILRQESPLGADAVLLRDDIVTLVVLAHGRVLDAYDAIAEAVLHLRKEQEELARLYGTAVVRGSEMDLHGLAAIHGGLAAELAEDAVDEGNRGWLGSGDEAGDDVDIREWFDGEDTPWERYLPSSLVDEWRTRSAGDAEQ